MDTTYQMFYAQYDEAIRAGADSAMRLGLGKITELLPYVLIPAIVVCGVLLATAQMTWGVITRYGWRVVLLVWLTAGSAYIPYVRDLVNDTIPDEIATVIFATPENRLSAAQQFDLVDEAAGHYVANVLGVATGLSQIGNKISAWQARGWQKFFLEIVFYVWVAIRMLLYLVVAVGAFLVLFLPFDSTRGWFMSMIGKMVGLTVWQLATSILLKIMLGGMQVFLRRITTDGATMSIEQQVDQCWDIAGWFLGCLVLMLMVPSACAVGSGIAASAAIAQGSIFAGLGAGVRAASGAGGRAGASASRALRSLSRNARRRPATP